MAIKKDLKNSEYIVSLTSQSSLVFKMHCFALKRGLFGAVSIPIEAGGFFYRKGNENKSPKEEHRKP